MGDQTAMLRFDAVLAPLLTPRFRRTAPEVEVRLDGTSSLGHIVEAAGVPLTEVGALRRGGARLVASYRPVPGDVVDVEPVQRPQRLDAPVRFLLDVHLGTLARRLRLLGIDAAYRNDAHDDELVTQAVRETRLLLTRDRGLLRRHDVPAAAYVRGQDTAAQLHDVLDRFAPPLAPWTRCLACNGRLAPTPKADVLHLLEPGTRRTQQDFARCRDCGRVYWRGAHSARLQAAVAAAVGGAGTTVRP